MEELELLFGGVRGTAGGLLLLVVSVACCQCDDEMADFGVGALSVAIRYLRSPS